MKDGPRKPRLKNHLLQGRGTGFWEQTPQEIDEQLRRGVEPDPHPPLATDSLDPTKFKTAITALKAAYALATKEERAFLRLLPLSQVLVWSEKLKAYRATDSMERLHIATVMVGDLLRKLGPSALQRPPVQFYLRRVWKIMHRDPDVGRRMEAKQQCIAVLKSGLPNLKNTKTRVNDEHVLHRFEDLKARVAQLLHNVDGRRARIQALVRTLSISLHDAEDLLTSSITRREALLRLTGTPFNRSASSVREITARAIRTRRNHELVMQGLERYEQFMGSAIRGSALHQALKNLGLPPLDPHPHHTMRQGLRKRR